ncbi:MAG: type II secretion system protein GspD, partial [Gammaproteobacteria bacterium]|nr:type II secretion system protein GspD [Gammaproteobacteria bacterium]
MIQSQAFAEQITLNLKEADIRALISTVSRFTGKNFIVDPRVKAKVTVVSAKTMSEKEVYEVFLSVLQVHGYAAVPVGNIIKIVPEVNAKQGPLPLVGEKGSRG